MRPAVHHAPAGARSRTMAVATRHTLTLASSGASLFPHPRSGDACGDGTATGPDTHVRAPPERPPDETLTMRPSLGSTRLTIASTTVFDPSRPLPVPSRELNATRAGAPRPRPTPTARAARRSLLALRETHIQPTTLQPAHRRSVTHTTDTGTPRIRTNTTCAPICSSQKSL